MKDILADVSVIYRGDDRKREVGHANTAHGLMSLAGKARREGGRVLELKGSVGARSLDGIYNNRSAKIFRKVLGL